MKHASADQQVRVVLGVVVKTGRALARAAALGVAVASDHAAEQDRRKDADDNPDLKPPIGHSIRPQAPIDQPPK